MKDDFLLALEEIETQRGVKKEIIIDSIKAALISSYRKNFNTLNNADIYLDMSNGTDNIKVFVKKTVVEEVEDDAIEISLLDAKEIDAKAEIGDVISLEITPRNFGRIAAQTAKQVVIQKIKDAERDIIYDDYIEKEHDLISGQINRIRKGYCFIDLGKIEGTLPPNEQIPGETYTIGDKKKFIINEVKKTGKGPQIILSRSNANFVRKLFELEVPEIANGAVEIFHVAREAGSRTKIAVFSRDEGIDAQGACIGYQGARVKNIVDELGGEKIDIIVWDKNPEIFIRNSLAPSIVTKVIIDEETQESVVYVPKNQLSLSIGKEGQNARLAARLTGWKIDIKSDDELIENNDLIPEEDIINNDSTKILNESDDLTNDIIDVLKGLGN